MKNLFIFIITSAITGVVGYKIGYSISKKHYEGLADKEVASVMKSLKEHYENKLPNNVENTKGEDVEKPKEKKNAPIDIPKSAEKGTKVKDKKAIDYGRQYRTTSEPERIPGNPGNDIKHLKKEEVDTTKPYIITSEEFNDSENECITLFYCSDKVLTDDDFNQITNIGIVGGYVILDQMGRYDSDCLYVRDEAKGVDYEILLDERTYDQIRPYGGVVSED